MSNTAEIKKKQFSDIVYSKFSDIPDELITNGFVTEQAIEVVLSKCQGYAQRIVQDEVTAKLTTLINLLSRQQEVHVLDYGGGLGQIFYAVERHLISPNVVRWHVLDVEEMVDVGKKKIIGKPNLRFYRDIRDIKKVDILFLRQSLQVLEKPYEVLKDVDQALGPKIIFLSGVPAGENETYLSLVLFNETKGAPCWIFNEDILINSVKKIGFVLIDRFMESITINLSNFPDIKYHLDSERKNHVKGYIFLKGNIALGGMTEKQ